MEPEPRPRALFISCRPLERPHVVEGGARVVAEPSVLSIIARKYQGIENGFGAAGLGSLIDAVFCVAVERFDLLPEAHALGDIVQECAFVKRGGFFSERRTEGRPRKGVSHRRMA